MSEQILHLRWLLFAPCFPLVVLVTVEEGELLLFSVVSTFSSFAEEFSCIKSFSFSEGFGLFLDGVSVGVIELLMFAWVPDKTWLFPVDGSTLPAAVMRAAIDDGKPHGAVLGLGGTGPLCCGCWCGSVCDPVVAAGTGGTEA